MSNKWGTFLTIVIGLFLLNLTACQSMGFNRGLKDYKKYHEGQSVRTWAYSYGYMRGWEYQKLRMAREKREEIKAIEANPKGILTPLTDEKFNK